MLRLKPASRPATSSHRWRAFDLPDPSTVFSERPPLRELVVVVDHELLDGVDDGHDKLGLLAGLLSHPHINCLYYRDEGPPADVARIHGRVGEFVPGWILLVEGPPDVGGLAVRYTDREAKTVSLAGLFGNAPQIAENDSKSSAYGDLEPADAATRRRADAIAVGAANAVHADLFVTRRAYLYGGTWRLNRDVAVGTPEQALPLVSLYLRAQGEFITYRSVDGTASESMNRGLFYWVGTRELLPAGWRWFTACCQHSTRDETMIYARVAHRALVLGSKGEYSAGWQRKDWLKLVTDSAPELAAAVAAGTRGGHALTILRLLRNSIHGAALEALSLLGDAGGRRDGTLVGLPANDAQEVVAAMDGLKGRDVFGVRELWPGGIYADPGFLLDALFAQTLDLLNNLMRLTPVERLPRVALSPEHDAPPSDDEFDEWNRNSIRWQLGLPLAGGEQERDAAR